MFFLCVVSYFSNMCNVVRVMFTCFFGLDTLCIRNVLFLLFVCVVVVVCSFMYVLFLCISLCYVLYCVLLFFWCVCCVDGVVCFICLCFCLFVFGFCLLYMFC